MPCGFLISCSRSPDEEYLGNNCRDHSGALLRDCSSCSIHGFSPRPVRFTQLTRCRILWLCSEFLTLAYCSSPHLLLRNIWFCFFVFFKAFFSCQFPVLLAELCHSSVRIMQGFLFCSCGVIWDWSSFFFLLTEITESQRPIVAVAVLQRSWDCSVCDLGCEPVHVRVGQGRRRWRGKNGCSPLSH